MKEGMQEKREFSKINEIASFIFHPSTSSDWLYYSSKSPTVISSLECGRKATQFLFLSLLTRSYVVLPLLYIFSDTLVLI